jgi:flagellar biosynthetic protein FliO
MLEDEAPSANYALRLTEALEAISSAESGRPFSRRSGRSVAPAPATTPRSARPVAPATETHASPRTAGFGGSLKALDALPPIRLPIGPAIPWRLGLPLLAASVAVVAFMSRGPAHADAQGVRLPTQEPYAVQQEAPLFTGFAAAQAQGSASAPAPSTAPASNSAPGLGVQDPGGVGFDAADIAFKLIAVLALVYGSLYLLKRFGMGGNTAAGTGGPTAMRVVSSLALAPNRSVHVLKVPGGKTLLVGATPNQVNLIADLGELADDDSPESATFFNVLKSKISN